MKKLLLSTVAVAAMTVAAPAFAGSDDSGVKLDVGGYFKGYGVYVDSDTETNRAVDMIRDTEVHLSGETTLDNGLTVGAHIEADADQADGFTIDESYAYFSGSWGRVNLGAEDGAAYLLQVAAPSADSNFDGIRQYVNPFAETGFNLDYDHDVSGKSDKVTYLSPVMGGFQAGFSWTPEKGRDESRETSGVGSNTAENVDTVDVAVRYEGSFDAVSVTAGAGYSDYEGDNAWNAGLDLGMGAFGVGVVYTTEDDADATTATDTWVVGVDYTTGPFTLGASYLNQDKESDDTETDRYAAGVTYAYGPGMTFRGSVAYQDFDTTTDVDGTAVMLGTQVNF
jgi:outer membrane protein OmpU